MSDRTSTSQSAGPTQSIKLIVDGPTATVKGASFGLPAAMGNLPQKVVEIGQEAFRASVAGLVTTVADALESIELDGRAYELSDVKFSIAFDAGGEVSIVSVAKGSVSGKTGIEIQLRRRPAK